MAIKVNLVPAEILAKAQQKEQMIQVGIIGSFVLVLVLLVSLGHWYRLTRLEGQLAEGQVKLKKLEAIVAQVEELERTAAAVRARLSVITDLLKGRPLYPRFMDDFARLVPGGVRIQSMTTSGGGSTAAPLKLTMSAEARVNDDIAAWVRAMEGTGKFSNVELGAVNALTSGDGGFRFTLTSLYTPKL